MAQVATLFEAGKLRATGDEQIKALDGGSRDLAMLRGVARLEGFYRSTCAPVPTMLGYETN